MSDTRTIYTDNLVWDDHCGFTPHPGDSLSPLLGPWREAGVGYLSINVYYDPQPWASALETIEDLRRRLPMDAPYCRLVSTVKEIDQARAAGEMAVTFDIEGMNALDGRLDLVQRYYDLGVRHMLFAYNRNNAAASGCHDEDTGITDFGRRVVDEMNRVGMVVDCSHTGLKTTMAAMEQSSQPVVFSHSNPKALVNHGRNITDDQIRACAGTGGVVGVSGVNLFLGEDEATPAAVAQHAAYVAELTSPEHVGISLDYAPEGDADTEIMADRNSYYWPENCGYDRPAGCLDVRRLPEVGHELRKVGFEDAEIAAVLGENFRRVAEQVWR